MTSQSDSAVPRRPRISRAARRLSAVDAPLFTVREAAKHLRVSTATLDVLCERARPGDEARCRRKLEA